MAKKKTTKRQPPAYVPQTKVENPDCVIYTDGGCSKNPGGPGGYGVVIIDCIEKKYYEYSGAFKASTNNRMEIMAVIKALEKLPEDRKNLRVYSDSQYFIMTADGLWNGNKNHDLWKRYRTLAYGKRIEYHWLRGHNGNRHNERCDTLASEAIQNKTRLTDYGYDPAEHFHAKTPDGTRLETGAMYIKINVPEAYAGTPRLTDKYQIMSTGVEEGCAEGILALLRKHKPSHRDYADLKTGGMDAWSRKTKSQLIEELGVTAYNIASKNLKECEPDILKALRWYGRGLPLDMSIRKVLVSNEISANTVSQNWKKKGTGKQ